MPNKNAKVIIPFVLVAWLASMVLIRETTPGLVIAAFVIALVVAMLVMIFYLMSAMGWSTLAERYRASERFSGPRRPCFTAVMAHMSVDAPDFPRNQMRFVGGTLRLGTTEDALHLSMLFSKVPFVGRFFPDVRIPWSAVTTARTFKAPGWFRPHSRPGAFFQRAYDPNYTGTFVELKFGKPPVFLQLPVDVLGEATLSRLPLAST